MEQNPSWEANRFSASQEILRILWNPKVHHRIHKCPPPVPILSQLDPVHVMSLFRFLVRTKVSNQVRDKCSWRVTQPVFTESSCQHLAQPPSWRTTPCLLSAIAYSIYSQLHSTFEAVPPSATWGRAMPFTETHLSRQILYVIRTRNILVSVVSANSSVQYWRLFERRCWVGSISASFLRSPGDISVRKEAIILYAFFWVIPQRLNFICRRFGTLYLFHLRRQVGASTFLWRWNRVFRNVGI